MKKYTIETDMKVPIAMPAEQALQLIRDNERLTAKEANTRALMAEANEIWIAQSDTLRERIAKLEAALQRIERGTADYWALVRIAGTALQRVNDEPN